MPTSQSFRIRVVAGMSILFTDGLNFDILDVTNNLLCVYDYKGLNWSLSTPVSVSFRGPWNNFRTRTPMDVERFGGMATFGSGGGLDQSVTVMTLSPLGYFPVDITPLNTGFTAGAGIGVGVGDFRKMFPAIPASRAYWPHNV